MTSPAVPAQPSADDLAGLFDSLSNWGRWGHDDERGTLNHLTDDRRQPDLRGLRLNGSWCELNERCSGWHLGGYDLASGTASVPRFRTRNRPVPSRV